MKLYIKSILITLLINFVVTSEVNATRIVKSKKESVVSYRSLKPPIFNHRFYGVPTPSFNRDLKAFSTHKAESLPPIGEVFQTDIGKRFLSLMSQAEKRHICIKPNCRNAFIYNHWLKGWKVGLEENYVFDTSHRDFYEKLYEKYLNSPIFGAGRNISYTKDTLIAQKELDIAQKELDEVLAHKKEIQANISDTSENLELAERELKEANIIKFKNKLVSLTKELENLQVKLESLRVKKKEKEQKLEIHKNGVTQKKQELIKAPDNVRRESYVNGHFLTVKKLNFPKFFLTLHSPNLYPDNQTRWKNKDKYWLIPLEQAFFFKTLNDYREALALPKMWDAYSVSSLIVIPKEAEVDMHVGLAKLQTFPKFKLKTLEHNKNKVKRVSKFYETFRRYLFLYFNDNPLSDDKLLSEKWDILQLFKNKFFKLKHYNLLYFNELDIPKILKNLGLQDEKKLYEVTSGGAIQFFLRATSQGAIYELKDAIFFPCIKKGELKFAEFTKLGEIISPKPGEICHLLCERYQKDVRLNFSMSLRTLSILTDEEYAEFIATLRYIGVYDDEDLAFFYSKDTSQKSKNHLSTIIKKAFGTEIHQKMTNLKNENTEGCDHCKQRITGNLKQDIMAEEQYN